MDGLGAALETLGKAFELLLQTLVVGRQHLQAQRLPQRQTTNPAEQGTGERLAGHPADQQTHHHEDPLHACFPRALRRLHP